MDNPGQTQPTLSTLPDQAAHRIKSTQTHQYALLADWRHSRTDTSYDSQGRVSTVDAHGDVSVAAQEKCTTTTYAAPAAANSMALSYPDQVTTVSGPCGTNPSASTLVADKKIYYDGNGTLTSLGTFGQLDQSGSSAIGQVSAVRTAAVQSGVVQEGAVGTPYVAFPADPAAYGRQAALGTGYVEFDVPRSSLYPAGEPGWAQIPGPNSLQARLALRRDCRCRSSRRP